MSKQTTSNGIWNLLTGLGFVVSILILVTALLGEHRFQEFISIKPNIEVSPGVVSLDIIESRNNAVIALVPVFIEGQGPYTFALDTGASRSAIDDDVVDELGLRRLGSAGVASGIGGQVDAENIQPGELRVGDVTLPNIEIVTFDFTSSGNTELVGLLGSDILRYYDSVTIDYESGELHLELLE